MSHASKKRALNSPLSDINESRQWPPQALPDSLRPDSRPVWEPPILDNSDLIGEVYEKKREAVLDLTGGDAAKTTGLMDTYTEEQLFWEYYDWVKTNTSLAVGTETEHFFVDLKKEVFTDWSDVEDDWWAAGGITFIIKVDDGSYHAVHLPETSDDARDAEYSQAESHVYDDSGSDTSRVLSINRQEINSGDHQDETLLERHGVSSPTDEAEELAWLASLDASAPHTVCTPQHIAQLVAPSPLALRLASLRVEPSTAVKGAHLAMQRSIDDID